MAMWCRSADMWEVMPLPQTHRRDQTLVIFEPEELVRATIVIAGRMAKPKSPITLEISVDIKSGVDMA